MTTSAKSALNAARAAQAAATRQKFSRTDWPMRPAETRVVGKTASGAIIRVAVGSTPPMPKGAPAGRPQGAAHWPNPKAPDAKPRPEFCVSANGKLLSPKLAELIRARIKPVEKSPELLRWESRLTGPQEKPADWPEGLPFYPGCTINPKIGAAVIAAEKTQR